CPAVSDVARKIPGAAIDWIIEEPFAGIAAMHACVRRVIPVAVRRWRAALWNPAVWSEIAAFRRALGAERYDAVIDTQSLLKSAVVSRLARGTRHGMDRESAREALAARLYDVTHEVPWSIHAVERNRKLAADSLGYSVNGACEYRLKASSGTAPSTPYLVFLTMTARREKLWPEPRWIELGRAAATPVVLPWGNDAERERAGRISRGLEGAVVPPRKTLDELSELFTGAKAVVGLDTGLTHLAAAL